MSALTAAAVTLGSVAAIITSLKLLFGFAPVRFVWRRLVIEPAREVVHTVVLDEVRPLLEEILDELSFNGGSSTKDEVRAVKHATANLARNVDTLTRNVEWLRIRLQARS